MAQRHTQACAGIPQGHGCWRTHSQSPGTIHTVRCTVSKHHTHTIHATACSTQPFRDPEIFSIQQHVKHQGKSRTESYGGRYSFILAHSRTSGLMSTRTQGRVQRREGWPPTGKKKKRDHARENSAPERGIENKPILGLQGGNGPMDRQTHPDPSTEERSGGWFVQTTEGLLVAQEWGARWRGGALGEKWQGLTQESLERQTQT